MEKMLKTTERRKVALDLSFMGYSLIAKISVEEYLGTPAIKGPPCR